MAHFDNSVLYDGISLAHAKKAVRKTLLYLIKYNINIWEEKNILIYMVPMVLNPTGLNSLS